MDAWFWFATLAMVAIGLVSFINKIFAERNYDTDLVTLTFYFFFFMISLFNMVSFGSWSFSIGLLIVALIVAIQDLIFYKSRLKALKYLSASNYFINVGTFSSIGLLVVGLVAFGDDISLLEYVGFLLGFIILYLLVKDDLDVDSNSHKGLPFLLWGIVLLIIGYSAMKFLSVDPNIVFTYIFLQSSFSFVFALIMFSTSKAKKPKRENLTSILTWNLIQGILFYAYFYLIIKAYTLGELAATYKIQSYSPFIAILLAIFIYKENITKSKAIALILAGISLWLFTI